jgi:hypothetical protein
MTGLSNRKLWEKTEAPVYNGYHDIYDLGWEQNTRLAKAPTYLLMVSFSARHRSLATLVALSE